MYTIHHENLWTGTVSYSNLDLMLTVELLSSMRLIWSGAKTRIEIWSGIEEMETRLEELSNKRSFAFIAFGNQKL